MTLEPDSDSLEVCGQWQWQSVCVWMRVCFSYQNACGRVLANILLAYARESISLKTNNAYKTSGVLRGGVGVGEGRKEEDLLKPRLWAWPSARLKVKSAEKCMAYKRGQDAKDGENAEDAAKTNKPVRKAYKLRYLCGCAWKIGGAKSVRGKRRRGVNVFGVWHTTCISSKVKD